MFGKDDFIRVNDFPLAYRWTDENYDLIPPEDLSTIRPLSEAVAARLNETAIERCQALVPPAISLSIAAEWDDAESVKEKLAQLEISDSQSVVVSWNAQLAALTIWRTFVRYWDAFCYPSSDDVAVWSPGDTWTLQYHHYEHIEFGRSD